MTEVKSTSNSEFLDWQFKHRDTEDGRWHWAEYYFTNPEDPETQLMAHSPLYFEGASDFCCLREDAIRVARLLREGTEWEEVWNTFRQAW